METKNILGLFALGMIALMGISLVTAYQGDYSAQGPNYSEDRHEAMQEAFENVDYDAWVSLMTQDGRHPRVVDVITEDNFAKFVEAHEFGMVGDSEKASELRAELGLNNGRGPKNGKGYGNQQGLQKGSKMRR